MIEATPARRRADGHVNPLRLLRALHAGLQQHGSRYLPGSKVETIRKEGAAFVVERGAERVSADKIVIAAGLGSAELAPKVGLHMPVTYSKGQILVTERVRKFDSLYINSLRQTDDGSIMIGSSRIEGRSDDVQVPPSHDMAVRCIECLPELGDLQMVRSWSGLRIMTPDGFPIYDISAQHPGAFAVTCHSGVTLAALHALHTAPEIVAGGFTELYKEFAAARFKMAA